jgi:pimeloyl-ACP methyl ester carboxylesterase
MRNAYIALLAAMAMLSTGLALAGPPEPPGGWTEGYVIANSIRIHYWRTGGNKTPLVTAHGSSDDGLCWTNLAKEFTANFDIIMYDARGHGLSDPPTTNDPPEAMREDLAALIKELNLVKPVIMGHSMGSSTAAWFAATYPDVPKAVVLEDPNLASRGGALVPPADREKRRAGIVARNNLTQQQLVADCMKGSPTWGLNECQIWAPSKTRHHPNTVMGGAGVRPAMADLLPKITAPTLILKADAQGDARKANDEAAKALKSGRLVHITGAGHNVRRENKAMTIAELEKFFAGL